MKKLFFAASEKRLPSFSAAKFIAENGAFKILKSKDLPAFSPFFGLRKNVIITLFDQDFENALYTEFTIRLIRLSLKIFAKVTAKAERNDKIALFIFFTASFYKIR